MPGMAYYVVLKLNVSLKCPFVWTEIYFSSVFSCNMCSANKLPIPVLSEDAVCNVSTVTA